MLVEYPCAMQRRNIYRWRKEDVYKYAVVAAAIILQIHIDVVTAAPAAYDTLLPKQSEISDYFSDISGCYYNFQRYEEGDRIVTNEPCLNCTCHNRMLMCYLRVCPFTKAIGQDCTIEKKPDQCCPIITCPEVPVKLLTSSTTSSPTPTTPTTVGFHDDYGCTIDNSFYADGAQVPSDPRKPCELCYCIRNRTACVMQECTLHVEGCKPVYQDGVCCPVRYDCDYEKEFTSTSHTQTIDGNVVKSTTYASVVDCQFGNQSYADGELITTDKPCEHCYCMRGDIVCAVQDCGEPLRGKDCVPTMPPPELCCPSSYDCTNDTSSTEGITEAPKPFSTDYPSQFSSIESSSSPSRTPAILSQEQIYEKLGEHTSLPSSDNLSTANSKTTAVWTEEFSTAHPSEDIQFDNHTVDVSEYSSTEREESTTSSTFEKLTTVVKEMQPIDYETEKSPTSHNPSSLFTPAESTIMSVETTTDAPVTHSSSKVTKIPISVADLEDAPSSDQSSHSEDTTANTHIYESTKSPTETTKFELNKIGDKITGTVIYGNPTTEISDSENKETTIFPSSASENEYISSKPSTSSEANRYTFTTREFDRTTTVIKEEMATKLVEEVVSTITSIPDYSQQLNEGVTESINTISERTTQPTTTRGTSTYSSNDINIEKGASLTTTEEAVTAQSGIPGEGSCLVDGITYANTSTIDSSNPCHQKCTCISSIPTCTLVSCQAPPNDPKCMPVQIKPESCCPVYICSSDEHEQIPPAQIPSHNQFAPQVEQDQTASQPVHDNQEEHESSEYESSSTDDHIGEEVAQSSSVSTSNKNTALEGQSNKDHELPVSPSLPTSPALPLSSDDKEATVMNSDVTEAVEPVMSGSVTEQPSISQTYEPTVIDGNLVGEDEHQKVTEPAELPPIVVTEIPEILTEVPVLSNNKESLSSAANVVTDHIILSTVTEKDVGEIEGTTITLVDSNELFNSSQEHIQEPSSKEPITPAQIVTEVITEEMVTEKIDSISEPVSSNENENKTQNEAINYLPHTTYSPSSSSLEPFESLNTITTLSSSYSDVGTTKTPSSDGPNLENEQSTVIPELVDSPSTMKETEAEMHPTNKPDNGEMLTTTHSELETSPAINDAYSPSEITSSTTVSGKPHKVAADEAMITSTEASETTLLPHEEATIRPSNHTTNEIESMDGSSENISEADVTSSPTEVSSKFSSVTESTYPKDSQYSPSTTITNLLSSTEYEEIKTTFPPLPVVSENVSESSSAGATILDEAPTTKVPEMNEIASGEVSSAISISQSTLASIYSNGTEEEPLQSSSETPPTYSPIQHSTWTPKPIDSVSSFSSSNGGDFTSTTSFDAYLHTQSSTNLSSGSDNTSMEEYDEEPNAFGPGTCRYNGKQYISAQQIPRDDPCDFCFCFRSDIICLQQSCPPPIHGCRQEPIQGFCCPRYECPVARDLASNATLQTTTIEATSPITTAMHPLRTARVPHPQRGSARQAGCVINGYFYNVGEDISIASGPCLECKCGSDGRMKCDPKLCSPEPYIKGMVEESSYRKR